MLVLNFKQEDRFVLLHTLVCWQYYFPPKMPSLNIFLSEQLKSMKICCLSWCVIKLVSLQQGNVEKISVMIEPLPCFIYRLDALTQPNQILLRINAKTNFCFAVIHRISNYDWCWMIYQNMLVVQLADFEKIKFEYDVMILIIARNCTGHCHYLHDFILCILITGKFASKITIICLILKVSQQIKIC